MSQIKSSVIENKFLRIKAINIGASLFEVFYKPKKINLILNLGNYKNYLLQKAYVGSTCGRVVNRIRNSQFSIGVRKYNLVANEGKSSLHGGIDNFSYRIWKLEKLKKNKIIYSLFSPDGDEGYPGNLNVQCHYEIQASNLSIKFFAKTDKSTHVNIANHAYWNLGKINKNIFDHDLKINSSIYLPNKKDGIPSGEFKNTKFSIYDFSDYKNLGKKITLKKEGFDANYVIKNNQKMAFVASLKSQSSKIRADFFSNQPGCQLYTSQFLKFNKGKNTLSPFQGVCLETQKYPNAANEKKFPTTLLKPLKEYYNETKINFSHGI
tara:strand:+ start:4140 stop:5105 length:966 start_codon:yes stop_codon:yes gene_type:complete